MASTQSFDAKLLGPSSFSFDTKVKHLTPLEVKCSNLSGVDLTDSKFEVIYARKTILLTGLTTIAHSYIVDEICPPYFL